MSGRRARLALVAGLLAALVGVGGLLAARSAGGGRAQDGPAGQPSAASPTTARAPSPTARPSGSAPAPSVLPTTTAVAPVAPLGTTPPPIDCAVAPARRALDPSRPRYRAELAVDVAGGTATGEATVAFTPDLAVDHLVFRLWANAPRAVPVPGAGLEVTSVATSAGVGAVDQPDPTTLVVVLGTPVDAGEVVEVAVTWRQVLPRGGTDRVAVGEGWARLGSVVPLLSWEPGVGWGRQPATSSFAEAAVSPAADWSVRVDVPPGYEVLGSGVLVAGRWEAEGARDVAVSIGRFRRAGAVVPGPHPVAVEVAVAEGLDDDPEAYLATVGDALTAFAARFGPYPWPAYTLALTPRLDGGIEYPGHVMQGPGTGGRTTVHEVAHQWFYGLVGNDQGRDPVLDEGLASYAELTHLGTSLDPLDWPLPEAARGRAGEPMRYWDEVPDSYYEGVYVQGALALAAAGPVELVDCALRAYVAEQAWAVATQGALVGVVARLLPAAPAVLASYGIS